jgi:hypothetical protein
MEIAALLVLWVAAMTFVAYSPDEVVKMVLLACWSAAFLYLVWVLLGILITALCGASCFGRP